MTHTANPQPSTTHLELAERLFSAVERGDIEALREIYAPDAEIWHNTDQQVQTIDQNFRTIGWIAKNVTDFRYEDIQRQATETGFIEQHMTRGTGPSGKDFSIPACIVCTVVDGRITRLDEYLDSAQVANLAG
jgi:ketosteroid isomerase-like protein